MAQAEGKVKTTMGFIARNSLYQMEKPYGAFFAVDHIEGAKLTNHELRDCDVTVHDARHAGPFNLDVHGFCFLKAKTRLTAEEADSEETIATQYIPELERILSRHFQQYSRFACIDFEVRKRHPEFPHHIGAAVAYEQPAGVPHVDFSVYGAYLRMKAVFPEEVEDFTNRNYDFINVWRVLKGPNDDWPLAICDSRSVDFQNDVICNDALYSNRVGENRLLHASDQQQWYYLSAQEEDDLIVFRNTDSTEKRPQAFHAAFCNPKSTSKPRESIEVRMVGYRY